MKAEIKNKLRHDLIINKIKGGSVVLKPGSNLVEFDELNKEEINTLKIKNFITVKEIESDHFTVPKHDEEEEQEEKEEVTAYTAFDKKSKKFKK